MAVSYNRANAMGSDGSNSIVHLLRRRHTAFRAKSVAGLILGLPLLLLGPAIVGTLFWVACWLLWAWFPWTWLFAGATLVMVPLLLRLEVSTGGDYLGARLPHESPTWAEEMSSPVTLSDVLGVAITGEAQRHALPLLIELFLCGPRLLIAGWRGMRAAQRVRATPLDLAARILRRLRTMPGAAETESVRPAGQEIGATFLAIAFLRLHEWIDISSNGARIWLTEQGRKALGNSA
jgi:hypothetical protein